MVLKLCDIVYIMTGHSGFLSFESNTTGKSDEDKEKLLNNLIKKVFVEQSLAPAGFPNNFMFSLVIFSPPLPVALALY